MDVTSKSTEPSKLKTPEKIEPTLAGSLVNNLFRHVTRREGGVGVVPLVRLFVRLFVTWSTENRRHLPGRGGEGQDTVHRGLVAY